MRESLIIACLSRKSNNFRRLKGQVVKVASKFLDDLLAEFVKLPCSACI